MFVPQRSYTLSNASLRQQILYPRRYGRSDEDDATFESVLEFAGLGELLAQNGLDARRDCE